MKVHDINVTRSGESWVLRAASVSKLDGVRATWEGVDVTDEWSKIHRVEQVFDNPEDVVTAIGRLLRDGV